MFDRLQKEVFGKHDIIKINSLLEILKKEYNDSISKIINKQGNNSSNDIIDKFIDKIFNKYSHKYIKNKILNTFVIDEIIKLSDNFNKSINYFIKNINVLEKQQMIQELRKIDKYSFKTYSYIIDIYFLRRFLDKDYITTGIVYMGVYHIVFYCYMLVKYFDFKITTISNDKNINKITTMIENNSFTDDIVDELLKQHDIQCSDLSNFPKKFE